MSLKKTRYRNVYRRRSGVYVYRFKDERGIKVQRTGTKNIETTEKLRRAAEDRAAEIRAGLNDPIAEQQRIDSEKPINEIIDAYCEYLAGKLRTTHHVRTTKNYIKKVVEAIGAKCLADIDALKVVADGVNALRRTDNAFVIVTHYQRLLDHIVPDFVHVLYDGRIVKSGDKSLAHKLEKEGYDWIKEEQNVTSV